MSMRLPGILARNTVDASSLVYRPERLPVMQIAPAAPPPPVVIQPPPVQPLNLSAQQAQAPGWGEAFGGLVANLLGGLGRKSSASDGGHTSAPHSFQPIVIPHSGGGIPKGDHMQGFAHGGFAAEHLVGKTIKYGEIEPEVAVDEQGGMQLLSEKGMGTLTRPAAIFPLSKVKAAFEQAGQPLPFEVPAAPAQTSSPRFLAGDKSSYASAGPDGTSPSNADKLDRAVGEMVQSRQGSTPAPAPVTPPSNPKLPGEGVRLSIEDINNKAQEAGVTPEEAHASALLQGYTVGDSSLSLFDGQPRVNQFADPSVSERFTSLRRDDAPLPDLQEQLRGIGDTSLDEKDRSTIPAAQRHDAIMAAADNESSPVSAAPSTASQAPQVDARRAQLEAELTKLYDLQGTKAVDHNGRIKSLILNSIRGALQGFATTGTWAGMAGGALSGGIVGGVHPAYDEELKQVAKVHEQQGKVDQALKIEKELASLDEMQTRAGAQRVKNSPDALASADHTRKMRDATSRLRAMGGGYTPGKDKTLDSLVTELGISPKRGGGGFNAQKLKVVGGNLVYVEHPDLPPVVLYTAGMSEADRQRNAIALESVNTFRKRNGEVPLMLASDLETADAAPSPERLPGINPPAVQQPVAAAPPERLPTINPPSTTPLLVPQPGAKPTAPIYGSGRHYSRRSGRSSSSGSSRSDSIGASLELRDAARYKSDAAQATAQAAAARGRGEDDAARAYDDAARVAQQNLDDLFNRRRAKRGGNSSALSSPTPKKGDPLGILDYR